MTTKIYALHDSDGIVRYIGKTKHSLSLRLANHLREARTGKTSLKLRWIQNVIRIGKFPKIVLIGEVQGNGNREEIAWIAYGKSVGWDLTNSTNGGGGDQRESICRSACFYLDADIRKELKIRARLRGKSKSWIANESLRHDFGLPPGQ